MPNSILPQTKQPFIYCALLSVLLALQENNFRIFFYYFSDIYGIISAKFLKICFTVTRKSQNKFKKIRRNYFENIRKIFQPLQVVLGTFSVIRHNLQGNKFRTFFGYFSDIF